MEMEDLNPSFEVEDNRGRAAWQGASSESSV